MSEDDDEFGPDVTVEGLKLRFRLEREGHAHEIERLRAEFGDRIASLERKVAGTGATPTKIHPNDWRKLPLREYEIVQKEIDAGNIALTPEAPEGAWFKARPRVTKRELSRMNLRDYEKAMGMIESGELIWVDE